MTAYLNWANQNNTKKPWESMDTGTSSLLNSAPMFSGGSNTVGSLLGGDTFDWNNWGKNLGGSALGGGASSIGSPDRSLMSSALQQRYADGSQGGGYLTAGLGIAQGLGNAWLGMKQYGVAKDSLNESKRQFGLNFGAQQKMTNMQIEDRMNLAKAEGRDGSYMEKYKV